MFGIESEEDSGQLCGEQFSHSVLSCHVGVGSVILTYVWC